MKKTKQVSSPLALSQLEDSASEVAAVLRAIANERRLMLLCHLIDHKELASGQLAELVGLSPSATSQHLAKMREEGLVTSRRDAQVILYRIADSRVAHVIALLKRLYCS